MGRYEELKSLFARLLLVSVVLMLIVGGFGYLSTLALNDALPTTAGHIITSSIIVVSSMAAVNASKRLIKRIESDTDALTSHQSEISYRFIQITVYVASGLLITSSVWNVNLSNVLLGAGVLGVLIGLSARQGLGAVISGIIIMGTNMFKVGDWVKFEDKFGRVSKITFFNTHFYSPHGELHIIPNDSLTSQNVTNISDGKYRNDLLVSVDYDCDLDRVLRICDEELQKLKDDDDCKIITGFHPTSVKEMGDNGIILSLKVWLDTPTPNFLNQSQTEVFTAIHERFDEEDIAIPFPQVTVSERPDSQEEEPQASSSDS